LILKQAFKGNIYENQGVFGGWIPAAFFIAFLAILILQNDKI
jgi:hypothetical protein